MLNTATLIADNAPPTTIQYSGLQGAYDYFNDKLFGGELPQCLIQFGANKKRCLGYFHANQWAQATGDKQIHTIALTPCHLNRPLRDVLGTLVHEMVHLWQQEYGEPTRNGYHNKQWGAKMDLIGLCPSNTGEPGGKRTGQQMTHYIEEGGPYDAAFKALPDGIGLAWVGIAESAPKAKPKAKKTKYCCPSCEAVCWGSSDLQVVCGECDTPFETGE